MPFAAKISWLKREDTSVFYFILKKCDSFPVLILNDYRKKLAQGMYLNLTKQLYVKVFHYSIKIYVYTNIKVFNVNAVCQRY